MGSRVDLHLHSNASDGVYAPLELVERAADSGLEVISLTDHDTIDGLEEAEEAAKARGLDFIPGVEINTDSEKGEIHILGYFIDHTRRDLRDTLEILRHARLQRAQKMVARLGERNIHIDFGRVKAIAGSGSIGRPHLAHALVEAGYASSVSQAMRQFLGRHSPVYVKRAKFSPYQAIELIDSVSGIPVLAHPGQAADIEEWLPGLIKSGLVGLEAYYGNYPRQQIADLVGLAEHYGLIVTGGSDFHGVWTETSAPLGSVEVPYECVEALKSKRKEIAA